MVEVGPILEVLVGKTIEQSLVEVMEEVMAEEAMVEEVAEVVIDSIQIFI